MTNKIPRVKRWLGISSPFWDAVMDQAGGVFYLNRHDSWDGWIDREDYRDAELGVKRLIESGSFPEPPDQLPPGLFVTT